jgi:hypothetical protein
MQTATTLPRSYYFTTLEAVFAHTMKAPAPKHSFVLKPFRPDRGLQSEGYKRNGLKQPNTQVHQLTARDLLADFSRSYP